MGETLWTCQLPFQEVWVRAHLQSLELEPDAAMEFVEAEHASLARLRMDEAAEGDEQRVSRVTAWQLRASCPFCEAGVNQPLVTNQWLKRVDWSQFQTSDTRSEEHFTVKGVQVALTEEIFGTLFDEWVQQPESPLLRCELPEGENAYGISLREVRRWDPHQLRLPLPGVAAAQQHRFGMGTSFGGLYQCPHCSRAFAVIYCAPLEQAANEAPQAPELPATVIQGALELTRSCGTLHPTRVTLSQAGAAITVRATVGTTTHELVFHRDRGTITLDGQSYVRQKLDEALFEHPLVASGVFAIRGLPERIAALLPPPAFERPWIHQRSSSASNVRRLIVANRFVGYPATFYREMTHSRLCAVYPLGGGLPREYARVPELFALTGLPAKKSLKRALFLRPTVLHALVACPDLPFRNVDVIRRFLELPDAPDLLEELNSSAGSVRGWRMLAEAKGEDVVLRFLVSERHGLVREISQACAAEWLCTPKLRELFACTPLRELPKALSVLEWQARHPEVDVDAPYEYSACLEALKDVRDGFVFELPACPRDYLSAGRDLHNCLGGYAHGPMEVTSETVVLVRQGGKLGAAVQVEASDEGALAVTTALGPGNGPLWSNPPLQQAVTQWMEAHHLTPVPDFDDIPF